MRNRVQKMMPFAGLSTDAQTSDASPLDTLFEITKSEGICLSYMDLSGAPQKLLGLYLIDPELGPTIILDDSLQSDDVLHAAVLAEEIGHHFTKVTSSFLQSSEVESLRDERKALWWAVRFLCAFRTGESALDMSELLLASNQ